MSKQLKSLPTFAERFAERLVEKLSSIRPAELDIAQFNDDMAYKTDWSPMRKGGTNFSTHKLVIDSDDRVEFVASNGGVLFSLVFAGVGLVILIMGLVGGDIGAFFCTGLFSLPFLGVGVYTFWSGIQPIVFDLKQGQFWTGFNPPEYLDNKTCCSINKIHAIQLIQEWVRGNKSTYYSYELNLVLKTGERIHVVDHGDREQMRADGQVLSDFLDVPVWDVIVNTRRPSRTRFLSSR